MGKGGGGGGTGSPFSLASTASFSMRRLFLTFSRRGLLLACDLKAFVRLSMWCICFQAWPMETQ